VLTCLFDRLNQQVELIGPSGEELPFGDRSGRERTIDRRKLFTERGAAGGRLVRPRKPQVGPGRGCGLACRALGD
jgi:hypothetical protein